MSASALGAGKPWVSFPQQALYGLPLLQGHGLLGWIFSIFVIPYLIRNSVTLETFVGMTFLCN